MIINDINKGLKEIESICQDPELFISEYFAKLTRKVYFRRKIIVEDIHKYSQKLVRQIEFLKQDCIAKARRETKTTADIDRIRTKLTHLNNMFDSSVIDDIKLEEIMSQKQSREISEMMEPALEQYKFDLQGGKYLKLIEGRVKYEEVFGSLKSFETDIDRIEVNDLVLVILLFIKTKTNI